MINSSVKIINRYYELYKKQIEDSEDEIIIKKVNIELDERFEKLTHLVFDDYFNEKFNYLPPNLKSIKFGANFNKQVDNLPNSIEKIIFGYDFNPYG